MSDSDHRSDPLALGRSAVPACDRSAPPAHPGPLVEVEAKYSIQGETAFRRILACAGTPTSVRAQLNCYLDGPRGDLHRMGWMARIRLTDHEAVLTLKKAMPGTQRAGDGVFRAVEIERPIPRTLARAWVEKAGRPSGSRRRREQDLLDPGPDAPREVREFLASGEVTVVTWSFTLRWTFRAAGRPDLLADETWFPDGSRDYEIEVESEDVEAATARALDVAGAAGVVLTPQTLTKHARAMRRRRAPARRRGAARHRARRFP